MSENSVLKAAEIRKQAPDEKEMALINAQSLKELTAAEVYAFKIAACDTKVDRDMERFTETCLEKMAELYVGKPVIMDHTWSAQKQVARIYAAEVSADTDCKRLIVYAYMPVTEENKSQIENIEAGILREVSVGCRLKTKNCSICGASRTGRPGACTHVEGKEYDGKVCHVVLDDPQDVFELSFVAVPAQAEAGVIRKTYGEQSEAWIDAVAEKVALRLEKSARQQEQPPGASEEMDPEAEALINGSRRLLKNIN